MNKMEKKNVIVINSRNFGRSETVIPNGEDPKNAFKRTYMEYLRKNSTDNAKCYIDESACFARIMRENGDIDTLHLCDVRYVNETDEDHRILSLSTAHITPEAVDVLSETKNSDQFQVFPYDNGCIIHIEDYEEVMECDFPSSVIDCIRFAYANGYRWIQFDTYANESKGLLTYRKRWNAL